MKEYIFYNHKVTYKDEEDLKNILDIVIDLYLEILGTDEEEIVEALSNEGYEVTKFKD